MTVAFVAGATGFVGRAVVRELVERGVDAVAHVRPDSPRIAEWRDRFEAMGARVDSTEWSVEGLSARLGEIAPTLVFSLLGTTKRRARAEGLSDGYASVDVGLTLMLLEAVKQANLRPRFVYLSSVRTSEKSRGSYLKARARVEQAVRSSGVSYTIARPSIITGPGRDDGRVAERMGAVIADGLLSAMGALGAKKLRERYRSTTNSALARALVRIGTDPISENRVIESESLRDG